MPRSFPFLAAVAVLLALGGCHSKQKRDKQQFAQAQLAHGKVEPAVVAGDLATANVAYQEARDHLMQIRRRAGRMGMDEYELPPGPELEGRTVQGWQELWKEELHEALTANFDALQAKAAAGELDWLSARGFLYTHAPELEKRWTDNAQDVDKARAQREGERIVFRCDSTEEGLCDQVRAALAAKAVRPFSEKGPLTTEGAMAAFGILDVKVVPDAERPYATVNLKDGTRTEGTTSIPARLLMEMTMTTRGGATTWDGTNRTTVEQEPPATIPPYEVASTRQKHLGVLRTMLLEKIATVEAQALR